MKYSTLFLFFLLVNALNGQAQQADSVRYELGQTVDFYFRTENLARFPDPQIAEMIDFLVEDKTIIETDEFRIALAVEHTTSVLVPNLKENLTKKLEDRGVAKAQIKWDEVVLLDDPERDLTTKGESCDVRIAYWQAKKIEAAVIVPAEVAADKPAEVIAPVEVAADKPAEVIVPAEIDNSLMDAYLSNQRKKYIQHFEMQGNEGKMITGEKGTILFIKPNSFVTSKGVLETGRVNLTLIEVYTVADRIIYQATTTSGNTIIETGGMFELRATNTAGEALEIAPEQEIIAVMASEESLLPGMQTFEGEVQADGSMDWQPTGNEVARLSDNDSSRIGAAPSRMSQLGVLQTAPPTMKLKLPNYRDVPSWENTPEPKPLELETLERPTVAGLKETNKQRANESNLNYSKRIARLYKKTHHTYMIDYTGQKAARSIYKNDSMLYANNSARFQAKTADYKTYKTTLQAILVEMNTLAPQLDMEYHCTYGDSLAWAFGGVSARHRYMTRQLNLIKWQGMELSEQYPTIGKAIDNLKAVEMYLETTKMLPAVLDSAFVRYGDYDSTQAVISLADKAVIKSWKQLTNQIRSLYQQVADQEAISDAVANQIRALHEKMQNDYHYDDLVMALQRSKTAITANKEAIEKLDEAERAFMELESNYWTEKRELGLITKDEIVQQYGSALGLGRIGWINCDRFWEFSTQLIVCKVRMQSAANTVFYLNLKQINSTIASEPPFLGADGYYYYQFMGVPKDMVVRLLGFKFKEDKVSSYFLEEASPVEFRELNPEFIESNSGLTIEELAQ